MTKPGFCDQEFDEKEGLYVCKTCGWKFHKIAHRPCKDKTSQPKQRDKNSMPPVKQQAWNLAVSLKDFVSDGFKLVDKEDYEARLQICDDCEFRKGNRCSKCGCNLKVKAKGRAFKCPEDKWDKPKPPPPPPTEIEKYNNCRSCSNFLGTACKKRQDVIEFIVEEDVDSAGVCQDREEKTTEEKNDAG